VEIKSSENLGGLALDPGFSPCLAQISAIRASLPEAEMRVADFIAHHPSLVLRSSINSVAKQSGTGIGTVARLCGRLGYSGFPELKIGLAVELLNPGRVAIETIQVGDDTSTIVRKLLHFGAQSLIDTVSLIDPREFSRAIALLSSAERIDLFAAGSLSGAIAKIAHHRMLTLGLRSSVHAQQPEQVLAAELLRPGDLVLALSNSGEAEPVLDALTVASRNRAVTIGVTGNPQSTLGKMVDILLLVASPERAVQGDAAISRLAMLAIVDALYACVLLEKHQNRSPSDPIE